MRFFSLAIALVAAWSVVGPSGAIAGSYETGAVGAVLRYCVPAIVAHMAPADMAKTQRLPELPPSNEARFLGHGTGKVFLISGLGGDTVLVAPSKVSACSVLSRQMNQAAYLRESDTWFGQPPAPFRKSSDKKLPGGGVERTYTGQVGPARLIVIVSARPRPVPGGIQGEITVGAVN